jgi:hypothetical protein
VRGRREDGFRLQVSGYRLVRSVGKVPLEYVGVGVVYCGSFQVPSFRWQVGVMTLGHMGAEPLPTWLESLTH